MAGIQGQAVGNNAKTATNYAAVDANGRPLFTAMHTPIIYGKTYSNKSSASPVSSSRVSGSTPTPTGPTTPIEIIPDPNPIEIIPDPNPVDKKTDDKVIDTTITPVVRTKEIVSDIPDSINPEDIPLITVSNPLQLPDIPEVDDKPDKTGVVEINPGDAVIPEPVGPNRAGGGDLPEEFDKYLVDASAPLGGGTNGGGKYFDDQSAATMAFADGTTSVKGYSGGTMNVDNDPWDWTKTHPIAAPLAAEIKPSTEQALGRVADKTEQYLGNQALALGSNAATKGIEKGWSAYNAPLTTQATNTLGTTATGAKVALPNAGAIIAPAESAYALSAPAMGGAGLGISTASAAPIGATLGNALPAVAAEGAGMAAAGSGAAATGAAMAGGEAALAAMGPIGWAVGAGLLAKKLKLF